MFAFAQSLSPITWRSWSKADFHLRDAVREGGAIVGERRIGLTAKTDELVTAAVEAIPVGSELEVRFFNMR
jgi:hypothetical protein